MNIHNYVTKGLQQNFIQNLSLILNRLYATLHSTKFGTVLFISVILYIFVTLLYREIHIDYKNRN